MNDKGDLIPAPKVQAPSSIATSSVVDWQPLPGSVLAEIVNALVPHQRAGRLAEFLRLLDVKIEGLSPDVQDTAKHDTEKVALIEDGAYSAARATSRERIERIVNCVANGIRAVDEPEFFSKRMLALFNEIDDNELLMLYDFYQKALPGRPLGTPLLGPQPAMKPEILANSQAGIEKLARLGLLRFIPEVHEVNIGTDRRVGAGYTVPVPKLEQSGQTKGRHWITYLGMSLLVSVGMLPEMPPGAERLLTRRQQ